MRTLVLDQHDRRREAAETVGLSFVRIKALRHVAETPSTLSVLAEALAVDRPYATVVVDELQKRGLVRRDPLPTDRRCKIVSATDAGRELAARAGRILGEPPPELRALSGADLTELDRILGLLVQEPERDR
ncbi:MAG: MarR family transcriptional regulator [Pseudonocardia sp.]|nr:MarR family transcriptional regulator [Pseudonocardia sp.]